MGVEQPWVVLRRSIRGVDAMAHRPAELELNGEAEAGSGQKVNEAIIAELGWTLLNEA